MEAEVFRTEVSIDESFTESSRGSIEQQVEEYIEGRRKNFNVSVDYPDSFTGRVMKELRRIPYGETVTYGVLASRFGTSALAVGQACGRNPVPIILPCHRVVASNGIGGYQYPGLKEKLLELESRKTRESSR